MKNTNSVTNPVLPKSNHVVVIVLAVLMTIVLGLVIVSFSSRWECQSGQWVKHGLPLSEKPSAKCEVVQSNQSNQVSQDNLDGYDEISLEMEQMAREADKPEVSGLEVTSLKEGDTISSPLVIKGRARGIWYFEGDFPVKIMDGKGNFFAESYTTAQGEWMTEDWVPFEATIKFSKPATTEGFVMFMRNNPSGRVENDYSVFIPVKFGQ